MYNLKITELTPQRDMPSLIKILLRIPGLQPDQISHGLKMPPLSVFSTENVEDALKLKSVLEKFGAVCVVENTEVAKKKRNDETAIFTDTYFKDRHKHRRKFRWKFWSGIFLGIGFFAIITSFDFSCERKASRSPYVDPPKHKKAVAVPERSFSGEPPTEAKAAKDNHELKKDIEKNPYNAEAWKALADNLEKQGDTASAHKAKESYERAVKTQMVLANLARAFGTKVRVEVTEDAVYYRTSYDFTEDQFNAEVEKLMDSLNVKFPGKKLFIENYTSYNTVQSAQLKPKQP